MSFTGHDAEAADQASLLSVKSVKPTPDTLTKLVKRCRALTLTLLPVQVEPASISEPTSRIITPRVISAYRAAAGDFVEALPYCLLRARAEFMWDANHNAADYDENFGRAIACEVLARRVVHLSPPDRQTSIMATRFKHKEYDGDDSDMASALEVAIDTHCTIFLSSSEAQDVVNSLWTGGLVQKHNDDQDVDYVPYERKHDYGFWSHLDATRLSVPRYQNFFRIFVWLFFLVVYSQAVREPLEKMQPGHLSIDEWEVVLYVLALSFCVEDVSRWFKLIRFVTWRTFAFWDAVALSTDGLLIAAFVLRIIGLNTGSFDQASAYRLWSFQVLSFVSPLIWMKLITVFDGYKYIGTMQICVARMLKESGIFFALLTVVAIGFFQGLYALDAADGETERPTEVINVLIQALFGSPNFDKFAPSPAGLWLYYFWNLVTAVILLNVLISLFSSAYSDVVDDAEAEYLAFFASKTVGMIRAPDEYVYPAPFNLLELFLIVPFELLPKISLSDKAYDKLNRFVLKTVFFIPLAGVTLFERSPGGRDNYWMASWLRSPDEGDVDKPTYRDPEVTGKDAENGLQISRVPFTELVKVFPNTEHSSEAAIIAEIHELKSMVAALTKKLEDSVVSK